MTLKPRAKPIAHWLRGSEPLQNLLLKAKEHIELLDLVKSRLPDPLCDHCCAASINEQELRLAVDSPAWSGRLRFMQGVLIRELRQTGIRITALKVSTVPVATQAGKDRQRRPLAPLTRANAELILQSAGAAKNTCLRTALVRLGGHSREI